MYIVLLSLILTYDPVLDWDCEEEPPIPVEEIELECSRRLFREFDARLLYPRGMARYYQRKFDVAYQDLEKAANLAPQNVEIQFRFGMAAYRVPGKRELVKQIAGKLHTLEGGRGHGQVLKALTIIKTDEERSLSMLELGNAEINDPEICILIGGLLFRQRKFEDAAKQFQKALIAPNIHQSQSILIHASIGMSHFAARRFECGIPHLMIAHEHSPSTVGTFVLLWDYWIFKEEYAIASDVAAKRYSIMPNDSLSQLNMALIHAHRREFASALRLARTADKQITDADWRGRLARVFWEAGEYSEALRCLQPLIDSGRLRARDEIFLAVWLLTCPEKRVRNPQKGLTHILSAQQRITAWPLLESQLNEVATIVRVFAHAANADFDGAEDIVDGITDLSTWTARGRYKLGQLTAAIAKRQLPADKLIELSIFDLWGTIDYELEMSLERLN